MEKERIPPPPSRDRTWVACVIHQRVNHYTTPTAESVSEKNIYICIRTYYGRLALSKVVIAFNDAVHDAALKTSILILSSCRSVHFDRPKIYRTVPKMAPFDLKYEADYTDNTTFFI